MKIISDGIYCRQLIVTNLGKTITICPMTGMPPLEEPTVCAAGSPNTFVREFLRDMYNFLNLSLQKVQFQ